MSYTEKASGAPITVTYAYMPIDKISNFSVEDIFVLPDDESILKNGFTLKQSFEEGTTYKKESIINVSGFYFFTIKDKAGNIQTE